MRRLEQFSFILLKYINKITVEARLSERRIIQNNQRFCMHSIIINVEFRRMGYQSDDVTIVERECFV